jgi:hypothetical protein
MGKDIRFALRQFAGAKAFNHYGCYHSGTGNWPQERDFTLVNALMMKSRRR